MTSDHVDWLRRLLQQTFMDTADEGGGWVSVVTHLMQVAGVPPDVQKRYLERLLQHCHDNETDRLRFLQVDVDAMAMSMKTPKVH